MSTLLVALKVFHFCVQRLYMYYITTHFAYRPPHNCSSSMAYSSSSMASSTSVPFIVQSTTTEQCFTNSCYCCPDDLNQFAVSLRRGPTRKKLYLALVNGMMVFTFQYPQMCECWCFSIAIWLTWLVCLLVCLFVCFLFSLKTILFKIVVKNKQRFGLFLFLFFWFKFWVLLLYLN